MMYELLQMYYTIIIPYVLVCVQVSHIYSGPLDEDDDDLTQAMTTCDPEVLLISIEDTLYTYTPQKA